MGVVVGLAGLDTCAVALSAFLVAALEEVLLEGDCATPPAQVNYFGSNAAFLSLSLASVFSVPRKLSLQVSDAWPQIRLGIAV